MRTLVFEVAGIPVESEVAKTKALPQSDDLTVIYFNSYDQLRWLDKECQAVLEGVPSDRHQRFLAVCEKKGLPLNEAKRLVTATRRPLQGGRNMKKGEIWFVTRQGGRCTWPWRSHDGPEWMVRKATFGTHIFSVPGVFDEIQERVRSQLKPGHWCPWWMRSC